MYIESFKKIDWLPNQAQPVNIPVGRNKKGDDVYLTRGTNSYYFIANGLHFSLFIPDGFLNDGASIPWLCQLFVHMDSDGVNRMAAIVHDWLYRTYGGRDTTNIGGYLVCDGNNVTLSRKASDQMFVTILRACGIPAKDTRWAYRGLRLGGRKHFGGPCPALAGKKKG